MEGTIMTTVEKITDSLVLAIIRTTQAAMSAAVGTFGLALIAAPVAVGAPASSANTLASARTAAFALAFADADPARSETVGEDLSSATNPLPPGTFTTSAHSDEWKIKNALSAGPPVITEHATVMDWPIDMKGGHGRVLRQGTNGWTCMPDVPGRPQHNPMCADETMMKWLTATMAGVKPNIDRVGLSYMLLGEARQGQNTPPAKDPAQVKEWFYIGPHVMIVLPDSAKEALRGINTDLSKNEAYVTLLNPSAHSTPLWVIPIAKSGERIRGERPN